MKLNKVLKTLAIGLTLALLCIPLYITPVSADTDPHLYFSSEDAVKGSSVTISGSLGYNIPDGVSYTIEFRTTINGKYYKIDVIQIPKNGRFTYTWSPVPIIVNNSQYPSGEYRIEGVAVSGGSIKHTFEGYLNIIDRPSNPTISLSTNTAVVGDTITISGASFPTTGTDPISISVDGTVVATRTSAATFSYAYKVPELRYGEHVVVVKRGTDIELEKRFNVGPTLILSKYKGDPESVIVATGTGFGKDKTVTFMIGNKTIGAGHTDQNGSFVCDDIVIPRLAEGSYQITISDGVITGLEKTFIVNKVNLDVSLTPLIYDYQTTGTISGVGLQSDGFIRLNYKHKTLSGYGDEINRAAEADDEGYASGTFTFGKNVPAGMYTVTLEVSPQRYSETFDVEVKPTIIVSKEKVVVGEEFKVEGYNFIPGSTIDIIIGDKLLGSVTVASNCCFSAVLNMPQVAGGLHSITVDPIGYNMSAPITVGSTFEFQETTPSKRANVGTHLVTSGSGFLPNATVTVVALDVTDVDVSKAVTLAAFKTDANGSFAIEFTITSALRGGDKNVTVTDGTNTYQAKLYMDNTAPNTPAPKIPASAERVRDKEQPITFGWDGSVDPSGVIYEFQLSLDPTFTNVLIDKTTDQISVTLSEKDKFTIDEVEYTGEKLPAAASKAPYYWRVRAYDTVGNVGEWSAPYSFTTGFAMPNWIIWVYCGVGIVIVLILGVMVGRKLAYRNY